MANEGIEKIRTSVFSRCSWPDSVKSMANWYCNNVKRYSSCYFVPCSGYLGKVDGVPAQVRADCSGFVSACLAYFGVYVYNPWKVPPPKGVCLGHVKTSVSCIIYGRDDIEFNVSQNAPSAGHINIPPVAANYRSSTFVEGLMKKGGFVKMKIDKSQWKAFDIIINNEHIEIFGGGNPVDGGKAYTWGRAWDTYDPGKSWTRKQILATYRNLKPKNHLAPNKGAPMSFESHMNYDTIYRYAGTPKSFPASSARS